MQGPTLAEYFQRTGIDRSALTPFVPPDKKPKSKVRKPSLSTRNRWHKLPLEPGIGKSIPAVGANWNDASGEGGEHTHLSLIQQVFALDHELAMAGQSLTGAV